MRRRWYLLDEDELMQRIELEALTAIQNCADIPNPDVGAFQKYTMIEGVLLLKRRLLNSIRNAKLEREQAKERETDGTAAEG